MKLSCEKKDKLYLWHPFTQTAEWFDEDIIVIDRAEGVYLYDSSGRRYIDGVSSLWCNVHGHRVKEIDQAVRNQLKKVAHSTFLGLSHIPAIELAENLVKISPKGLKRVFFSNSGSEAIEVAIKMAFQYCQLVGKKSKKKFIALTEAYHGDTLGAVSVGGIALFHSIYSPLLFEVIRAPTTYSYRCKISGTLKGCAQHCIDEIEAIVRKKGDDICALIIEPRIQCAGGMITQPDGFLREIRNLCTRYDILLIADEVATGFGRTGTMFACDYEGVTPDIMVIGKGLTGGYLPLSATLTTERIFNAFTGRYNTTFFHGHTYTANPLACAAANANIKLLNKIIRSLSPKIAYLARSLKRFKQLRCVGDIRQCGFIAGIEPVKDKESRQQFDSNERIGRKVCLRARNYDIIIRPIGDIIVIMPPLSITRDQLSKLLEGVYKSIKDITGRDRMDTK